MSIQQEKDKHCDILIKDATVFTGDEELLYHTDIAITDGLITEIGEGISKDYQSDTVLGGDGKLFMPGLVDSHMHTGQQLLRGLVLDAKPIIWVRIMLPFESTLTADKMHLSAQSAALEMIKSGTTGFIESGSYFMDEAAKVYMESGLRGALSYSTMDEEGLPDSIAMDYKEAVKHTDELYDAYNGQGKLKVYYSLRALNSCSDELVELAADRARERNTMLQAHMNEYPGEINGIIEREGMEPYLYLDKMGALSSHFLGAHSLILTEEEMDLIKARGSKVCHCPFSNCGKAVPDTPKLLAMGIPVGLGTDGAAHGGLSLWNEMKIFRSVINVCKGVPAKEPAIMPATTILKMATQGGAAALDEEGALGKVEPGYKADLISINMDQPHLCPTGNPVNTLLECVNADDVWDSIVGGQLLMKDRQVLTMDEEKILWESKKYMEKQAL